MPRSGGVAIPMQKSLSKMDYLVGEVGIAENLPYIRARKPFSEDICDFLNNVSKVLLKDRRSREYSDLITYAFWIRKASTAKLKDRFLTKDGNIRLGQGVAFHVAPSNVPVNFAYSLSVGLLAGNANVVRVPSKDFPQVGIIADAFNTCLAECEKMKPYVLLVRYGHDKEVNDILSWMADVRIIWGGDATIAEIRKSPLPPRSTEVTFADRYSIAVIDSDVYMQIADKDAVAQGFYNDTYLSDQNACTSPRLIVWTGNQKKEASSIFWEKEHEEASNKYTLQAVQAVNKLTSSYLLAANQPGMKIRNQEDNLIMRVQVPVITAQLMEHKDNSGFFMEYYCDDILDLLPLCDNKACQTIGILGDKGMILPLLESGIKGVDRVVSIGKTMDFDLIWDGYDLISRLSRIICM